MSEFSNELMKYVSKFTPTMNARRYAGLFAILLSINSLPFGEAKNRTIIFNVMGPWETTNVGDHSYGLRASYGAVLMAIEDYMPVGVKPVVRIQLLESDCDVIEIVEKALFSTLDLSVSIGPPCSTGLSVVGILRTALDTLLLSWYGLQDEGMSDKTLYKTLVRVSFTIETTAWAVTAFIQKMEWKKAGILWATSTNSQHLIEIFEEQALLADIQTHNMSLGGDAEREEINNALYELIFIKQYRIIIIATSNNDLLLSRILEAIVEAGLNVYEFVYISVDCLPRDKPIFCDPSSGDGWGRCTLNTTENIPVNFFSIEHSHQMNSKEFSDFTERLVKTQDDIPLTEITSDSMVPIQVPITPDEVSPYAAYLYDTMTLFSLGVTDLVNSYTTVTNGDGTLANITNLEYSIKKRSFTTDTLTAMRKTSFHGMTGLVTMNDNNDRISNFTIMRNSWVDPGSDVMFAVAFVVDGKIKDDGLKKDHYFPDTVPSDEPSEKNVTWKEVILALSSIILFFIILNITLCVVRKKSFEHDVRRQLWKFQRKDLFITGVCNISDVGRINNPLLNASMRNRKRSPNTVLQPMTSYIEGPTERSMSIVSSLNWNYCEEAGNILVGTKETHKVVVKRLRKDLLVLNKKSMTNLKMLHDLKHENLLPFFGACENSTREFYYVCFKLCSRGSLRDLIDNSVVKLDWLFKVSLANDMIIGLDYLHRTCGLSHGNLKSTNCIIESRFILKLADYAVLSSSLAVNDSGDDDEYYSKLIHLAPEILRKLLNVSKPSQRQAVVQGTQPGDVYSVAIVLYELMFECRAYKYNTDSGGPKDIISKLAEPGRVYPYRPVVPVDTGLYDPNNKEHRLIVDIITDSWVEQPDTRLTSAHLKRRMSMSNNESRNNLTEQLMKIYAGNLEDMVSQRTKQLKEEKQRADELLYSMLPKSVADKKLRGDVVEPEAFDSVSIFFSDIEGFTAMAGDSSPLQIVNLLNQLYTMFDNIIDKHDVYKVETIGDSYMLVSGLPVRNGARHTAEVANVALELCASCASGFIVPHMPDKQLRIRIGLHTGECHAGIVGTKMPRYCLFGDTVNMASRMESTGKALKIQISAEFNQRLMGLDEGYVTVERGLTSIKGKSFLMTYWLLGNAYNALQSENFSGGSDITSSVPSGLFKDTRRMSEYIDSIEELPGMMGKQRRPSTLSDQMRTRDLRPSLKRTLSDGFIVSIMGEIENSDTNLTHNFPSGDIPSYQQMHFPHNSDSFPGSSDGFPQNIDSFPQNIDSFPQNIDSFPQNIDSFPQNIDSFPQNIDSFPQNIDSFPQNIDSFPQNITNFRRNMDNFPEDMTLNFGRNIRQPARQLDAEFGAAFEVTEGGGIVSNCFIHDESYGEISLGEISTYL